MKYISILFAAMLLVSCGGIVDNGTPLRTDKTENNYNVTLLFEHDGCKVYTFYDQQRVYYTTCDGSVSWDEIRRSGKHSYTEHHNVTTSVTDSSSNNQ